MNTNGQNGQQGSAITGPAFGGSDLRESPWRGERPTVFVILLFFLLFSGPPSFRLRDPFDSIEGVVDPTVVFQSLVWVVAGIWCLLQLRKELRPPSSMRLALPQKLGLVMVFFLALSTFESEAPLLTAFKVGQLLVSLLFAWIFVHRYGIVKVFDYVFPGCVVLSAAIGICIFAAPDLVYLADEEGKMRLHGDPIAPLPTVVTFGIILLFVKRRQIPNLIFWPLLSMLSTLLAVSLTRHAWFLVGAFLLLYFARHSKGPVTRTIGFVFLAVFPIVFFLYILPAFQDYRATDSALTLTGRTDLWLYLVDVALTKSAWTGLGYYSASRVLGIDFNPGMGTAHSIFVEVLLGGGLLSLIPCIALCFSLTHRALQLLSKKRANLQFVCGALFLVTIIISLLGGDFASGEIGIIFWSLAAAIPAMQRQRSLALQNLSPTRFTKLARASET